MISLDWQQGSQQTIDALGADGAVVEQGLREGSRPHARLEIPLLTPTGELLPFSVKGIFDPPTGGSPFGTVTISSATFDEHWQQPLNLFTFVKMRGGESPTRTRRR